MSENIIDFCKDLPPDEVADVSRPAHLWVLSMHSWLAHDHVRYRICHGSDWVEFVVVTEMGKPDWVCGIHGSRPILLQLAHMGYGVHRRGHYYASPQSYIRSLPKLMSNLESIGY
jgi:hypothetical protein